MALRPTPGLRSASFNGMPSEKSDCRTQIRRPRSLQELLTLQRRETADIDGGRRLRRVLLHVTVQRSIWPVQVMMSPEEDTVADLIGAAVEKYVKEGRRPLVSPAADSSSFDLHYSQFSLESLHPEEKLINLGSRSFFLCMKQSKAAPDDCSDQVNEVSKTLLPLLRFINS